MSFWGKNPISLLESMAIIPCPEMSRDEKLNSLTRLAIVCSVVLYLLEYKHWLIALVIAIALIFLAYLSKTSQVEGFTITPLYVDTDFTQTQVAPTYSGEWQVPPPVYEQIETIPPADDGNVGFMEPMKPQNYPYGQILSTTNTLPYDDYNIRMMNGGVEQARSYANSAFLRHRLAFQDNISRVFKKSLARRFRHNNVYSDTVSPYCGT